MTTASLDQQSAPTPHLPAVLETALICLAGIMLFFPWLGEREIWTSGEARVAQVARQMIKSDSYIIPMIGSKLRLEKPPLAYWMAVGSAKLVRDDTVGEFAARLPSAIAGIIVMCFTAWFGRALFGGWGGLFAGLAAGTTGELWQQSRISTIEMTQLAFIISALYFWWRYHDSRQPAPAGAIQAKPKPGWLVACYIAMALAALDKGPVGPLLVVLIAWTYILVEAKGAFWRNRFYALHHVLGLLAFLVIALPWPAAVVMELSRQGIDPVAMWKHQSLGRFKGFDHIKNDPFYFVLKLFSDGQPWTFFALAALGIYAVLPSERKNFGKGMLLPLVWMAVTLVFFSIPASKKSYYILPIYPSLALAAGGAFAILCRREGVSPALSKAFMLISKCVGYPLILAGLAIPFTWSIMIGHGLLSEKYEGHEMQVALISALAIASGWRLVWRAGQRQWLQLPLLITAVATCLFAISCSIIADMNQYKGYKGFCLAVKPLAGENDLVATFGMSGTPIFTYYIDRNVVRIMQLDDLTEALNDTPPARKLYIGVKNNDCEVLQASFLLEASNKAQEELLRTLAIAVPKQYDKLAFIGSLREGKNADRWQMLLQTKEGASSQEVQQLPEVKSFLNAGGSLTPISSLLTVAATPGGKRTWYVANHMPERHRQFYSGKRINGNAYESAVQDAAEEQD